MGMGMHHRFMPMPMRMRFARRIAGPVLMLMMFVVHVLMFMFHRFVRVFVFVPLSEVKPHTNTHKQGTGDETARHRLVKRDDRKQGADERRGREIRACASRSKVSQRDNEQHETDAIAHKAKQQRFRDRYNAGPRRALRESQQNVHGTRDNPFEHRDLNRIAAGNFLREVVVDRPTRACRRDSERANEATPCESTLPRDHGAAGDDRQHPKHNSPVDILAKYDPSDRRCEYAFKIE